MRDPGSGTYTPTKPSLQQPHRAALRGFLASQAHQHRETAPLTASSRQASLAAHQDDAQHWVDHYGDDPARAEQALRRIGFSESMLSTLRADHPTTDAHGATHITRPAGEKITLPKAVSTASIGPSFAGDNPVGRFLGRYLTAPAGKAASQLGHMAVQAAPGAIHLAGTAGRALAESDRAGYVDAHDQQQPHEVSGVRAKLARFDPGAPAPHVAELEDVGRQSVKQVGQDFAHPLRNPGYLAVDLATLFSAGAAGATRLSAASRAFRAAEDASRSQRLSEAGSTLLARPAPETAEVTARGPHGPVTVNKPLSTNPAVKPIQRAFYRRVERKLNEPAGPSTLDRLTEPRSIGGHGFGIHPVAAKPLAGAIDLPGKVFGPKAVFRRGLNAQRRTERAVLGAPAEDLRATAGTKLPNEINLRLPARLRRGLSPEEDKAVQAVSILGRDAITAPEQAVNLLRSYHLRSAATALEHARSAADQAEALRGAAEELYQRGSFDELAQLEQQVAELEGHAHQLRGAHERHTLQAAQFEGTLPVLKAIGEGTASGKMMEVLPAARAVADARKALLKKGDHLSDSSETFREAAPGHFYEHEQRRGELQDHLDAAVADLHDYAGRPGANPHHVVELQARVASIAKQLDQHGLPFHDQERVVATSAENPEARAAAAHLRELDAQIEKVRGEYQRSAKRKRPKTAHEARQELTQLQADHEKLLRKIEAEHKTQTVTEEEAAQLLHDHDRAIAEAADRLEYVKTHGASLGMAPRRGVENEASKMLENAAAVSVAEKKLKKLQRERKRFVDAVKTGKLRIPADPKEVAARNRLGRGAMPTLAEEARQYAEQTIERLIARHADEPAVRAVAERIARIEQLTEGLARHHELEDPVFGEGKTMTAEERIRHFGTAIVGADPVARQRLGTLTEYRDVLQKKLEDALGHDPKLHTLIDDVILTRKELEPREGAFRAPLGSGEPGSFGSPYAAPYPGKGGIPPVDAARRDSALNHEFTAGEIRHGDLTGATVDAIASSYLKAARIHSQEGEYGRYWRLSTASREHEGQVPIREPKQIPLEFKQELRRIADRPEGARTLAELETEVGEKLDRYLKGEELTDADRAELTAHGLPDGLWRKNRLGQQKVVVPLGTDLSKLGIRWVDKDYLEPPRVPRPHSYPMAAVDFLNDLGRLGVYARGGYVLNLPSNWMMQALEQGYLAPQMYRRAFGVREKYGNELASKIEAQVGEGRARAYNLEGHGGVGKATSLLASMWSSLIDRHSRVSAFLYWAHRHGVDLDDPKQVAALFDDHNRAKLIDIRERANKSMVQFDNLAPLERDTLRHLVYFYPWVSRATAWAVRTLVEHPYKTFTLGQLARIQQARVNHEFGQLPSSLRDRGYMPFKIGGKTYAIGTASINPLQTISDVGRQLASPFDPQSSIALSDAASPALQAALELGTGRDQYGNRFKGSTVGGVFKDVFVAGTPQGQALQRGLFGKRVARLLGKRTDYSRQPEARHPLFPDMGPAAGLGPLAIGSLDPRRLDLDAAHAKAEEERINALPPVDRAAARAEKEQRAWLDVLQKNKLLGAGDVASLKPLLDEQLERTRAYAEAAQKLGVPLNRLTIPDRFHADVELAVQRGKISQADAQGLLDGVKGMSDGQLKYLRRRLQGAWFTEDHVLAQLQSVAKTYTDAAGASSSSSAAAYVVGKPAGLVEQGNIDLNARPTVHNQDGSVSTVRSITIGPEDDGHYVLVPTVVNGRVVSNDQAVAYYRRTGQNLGKFSSEQAADTYAEQLHNAQAKEYAGG